MDFHRLVFAKFELFYWVGFCFRAAFCMCLNSIYLIEFHLCRPCFLPEPLRLNWFKLSLLKCVLMYVCCLKFERSICFTLFRASSAPNLIEVAGPRRSCTTIRWKRFWNSSLSCSLEIFSSGFRIYMDSCCAKSLMTRKVELARRLTLVPPLRILFCIFMTWRVLRL